MPAASGSAGQQAASELGLGELRPSRGDRDVDGFSSTRQVVTGDHREAGVDTWRLLFRADASSVGRRLFDLEDGYRGQWFPDRALLAVEGHPAGRQVLARPSELRGAFERVCELVEPFGGAFLGPSRLDLTTSFRFGSPAEGRAYFAGMAAIELPRCETTRRGHPVHSVWWTGARSAEVKGRTYDKGLERGNAEAFELGRIEDQRRFRSGARPSMDELADGAWCRDQLQRRFAPVARATEGVRAASFPVIAQALADEARYGYRTVRQAERLAGALVLLSGGVGKGDRGSGQETWFMRRRRELRDAGFVVCGESEAVEVELAGVLEGALSSEAWA